MLNLCYVIVSGNVSLDEARMDLEQAIVCYMTVLREGRGLVHAVEVTRYRNLSKIRQLRANYRYCPSERLISRH